MNKQKCVKLFRHLVEENDSHLEFINNNNILRHIVYLPIEKLFDDESLKIELVKDNLQQVYYFQFKTIKLLISNSVYNSLHRIFFRKYFYQSHSINKDDTKKLTDLFDKFLTIPVGVVDEIFDEVLEEIPLLPEIDPAGNIEDFIKHIDVGLHIQQEQEYSNEFQEYSNEFIRRLLKL